MVLCVASTLLCITHESTAAVHADQVLPVQKETERCSIGYPHGDHHSEETGVFSWMFSVGD